MNYADPELRSRLAAEYALGTLRGPARRRFERLMGGDSRLRELTEGWEQRLNLLAESAPAVEPPERLWASVAQRLGLEVPSPVGEGRFTRLWGSIAFWRGASLVAVGAAAVAVAVIVARPEPPSMGQEQIAALDQRLARIEGIVQRQAVGNDAVATLDQRLAGIENRLEATVPRPSHVAVLIDKYARPMMTADLDLADGRLALRLHITPPRDFTGKALEVWFAPPDGAPRPLGLLPSERAGTTTILPLPQDVAESLARSSLLVSLEPTGGSTAPRPTGPVLFSGAVVPVDL